MSDFEFVTMLPNGHRLYREKNTTGGFTYYSDENGLMAMVWDTCLFAESTLLAALVEDATYLHALKRKT